MVPKRTIACERTISSASPKSVIRSFRPPYHPARRCPAHTRQSRRTTPQASLSFRPSPSHHHRPAGLLFEHAADALDNARFTEAAAILEEALVTPSYASVRVPLPPHWSLLQLQTNLVECLLHAKQYARVVTIARRLRTVVPRHAWGKLLWLESIALARVGLHDAARDVYCSAFLQTNSAPCVPHAHQEAMHVSLLVALGVVDTEVPTPPDMHRVGSACDPAYPFVTVCDDCVLLEDIDDVGLTEWDCDACVLSMLRMTS